MKQITKEIQQIIFEKNNGLILEDNTLYNTIGTSVSSSYAFTFQLNLESYGFVFSKDLLLALSHQKPEFIKKLNGWMLPLAKKKTGAHVSHKPMYPNFPKQVIEASDLELLVNALVHYTSGYILGNELLPSYKKEKREIFNEYNELKVIKKYNKDIVSETLLNILNSNASISEMDKEHAKKLHAFVVSDYDEKLIFQSKLNIVQKETLAFYFFITLDENKTYKEIYEDLKPVVRTSIDVLRLAAAISTDGLDTQLTSKTQFSSPSRKYRKLILFLLNNIANENTQQCLEDMFKYKEQWIRLAEKIHSKEYINKNKFKKAALLIQDLRKNTKPISYNKKLDELFLDFSNNEQEIITLLKQKPGEFARKLNKVLQACDEHKLNFNAYKNAFNEVAEEVSTPVLLQARNFFVNKDEDSNRVFIPKGNVSNIWVEEKELNPITNNKMTKKITDVIDATLIKRFSYGENLGRVFIDPKLKDIKAPHGARHDLNGIKTFPQGSKFDLGNKNITRFFIYWTENGKTRQSNRDVFNNIDLDLSCALLDKDFNMIDQCSFTNIRSKGVTHSGDIVMAPNGASEFIDIDHNKIDKDVHYVSMMVFSYSQQAFNDIPECFAGWMNRDKPQSGKIFEAKSVQNKIDLIGESRSCVPMLLDIKNKKVLWIDMPLSFHQNMLIDKKNKSYYVHKGMFNLLKPNLYDLFNFHAQARGNIVNDVLSADTVFFAQEEEYKNIAEKNDLNQQKVIFGHQLNEIASKYMANELLSLDINSNISSDLNTKKNKIK